MDQDHTISDRETRVVRAAWNGDAFATPGMSGRCSVLIAASWIGFVGFILYPELQLVSFGAVMLGLALVKRANESVQVRSSTLVQSSKTIL